MRRAQRLGCNHEFAARQSEGRCPGDAHEGGNTEHAENASEIEQRLSEIGGDGKGQYQWWKGEQHIHAAHDHRLKAAAKIAGEHAKGAADGDSDDRRTKTDRERDPRTIEKPGQFVATEAVVTKPVQSRRWRP